MTPALDLERGAIGTLRLGDPIAEARFLGPAKRTHGSAGDQVLEYDAFGLEFQGGHLVCVKFELDQGDSVPVGAHQLMRATTPLEVRAWFGEPSSDSTGGAGFRWIDYEHGAATLALEFDANGLGCVQLYAEGYA